MRTMSTLAAAMMKEDMDASGPVRLRQVLLPSARRDVPRLFLVTAPNAAIAHAQNWVAGACHGGPLRDQGVDA